MGNCGADEWRRYRDRVLYRLRQRDGRLSGDQLIAGYTNCASLAEGVGYFSAARCKIGADIYASGVGPLTSAPGRIVSSGGTITITGYDFGDQCTSCQVLANPVGSTTQTALQVSSWTGTSISAMLPASL